MRAPLLLVFALAVTAGAQEHPLAPGGQPLPVTPSRAPAACGGFVDAERGLSLGLWEASGGGLEGELTIGQRGYPVRLTKGDRDTEWSGTLQADERTFPLSVLAEPGKLILRAEQVEYTLFRSMTAAQLDQVRAQLADLARLRVQGNEAFAMAALRTLTTAQALFREGDKENDGSFDYASSLQELGGAQLIDAGLASGTKQGYRFELRAGDPIEFLWAATANPIGEAGGRSFFVNHEGVVYYTSRGPIALPADCKRPRGLTPVGKEEGSLDQDELDEIMAAGQEALAACQSSKRASGATAGQAVESARGKLKDAIGRLQAFLGRPQSRVEGRLRPELTRYEGYLARWQQTLADLERGGAAGKR